MHAYLSNLLRYVQQQKASDLHLRAGEQPALRVDGSLTRIESDALTGEQLSALLLEELSKEQQERLQKNLSVDLSIQGPEERYRVNIFYSSGEIAAVFRQINEKAPTLAEIGAPETILRLAREPRGLLLVTGPTGSGKTTTLAAVIDLINIERKDHILTIEDPVEFIHHSKKCLVSQREIGRDARDFASALRDGLREDPDVILVGEMRDYETISIALTAAETGHLVLGTLHTSSAPGTVDRIIDAFPTSEQQQAKVMLANSLLGVVAQTLLPKKSGEGRVAAHEILLANNPVRALIRKQNSAQLRSVLQTSVREGMQTLDRSLASLVGEGLVSEDEASKRSQSPEEFDQLLRKIRAGENLESIPKIKPEQLPKEG